MENNFYNSIKITKEKKTDAMITILQIVMNSSDILSLKEVLQYQPTLKSILSEDEILATYSLAKERKILKLASKHNERLSEYLNEEKILEFIDATVEDIKYTRKTPNVKWSLSINKILSILERRKRYSSEETLIMKKSEKTGETRNIIDIKGYLEK